MLLYGVFIARGDTIVRDPGSSDHLREIVSGYGNEEAQYSSESSNFENLSSEATRPFQGWPYFPPDSAAL